jgi:hypothetical protein
MRFPVGAGGQHVNKTETSEIDVTFQRMHVTCQNWTIATCEQKNSFGLCLWPENKRKNRIILFDLGTAKPTQNIRRYMGGGQHRRDLLF